MGSRGRVDVGPGGGQPIRRAVWPYAITKHPGHEGDGQGLERAEAGAITAVDAAEVVAVDLD